MQIIFKGTCGFLGYYKLESVARHGENLLSRLRDGELVLARNSVDHGIEMPEARLAAGCGCVPFTRAVR